MINRTTNTPESQSSSEGTTVVPPPAVIMPEFDKPQKPCEPGEYLPDDGNCNAFYRCVGGVLKKQYCAGGLHWNRLSLICDWPGAAKCKQAKRKNCSWTMLWTM